VLDVARHLEPIEDALRAVRPMPAAFDPAYVKKLDGSNVMPSRAKRAMLDGVREDIRRFRSEHGCDRMVMVWCGSTEVFVDAGPAHADLEAFEAAIDADDPSITPSMLYAYAALLEGVPFANGAPNLTVDVPALRDFASASGVPICGKDFKTGQTMVKTVLAPMFKARMLGMHGWYSTNILGNRDGEVLDDPESFRTKETSKLGVLDTILQPDRYPQLYGDLHHVVRINYYPPRGDNKEGWDNVDFFGWLGYPMQMKVDFLCRDSILAAPLVLDLALFLDLAAARRDGRHPGVAQLLLQGPAGRAGPVSRARPVHPADQAEEHAALDRRRGSDHPSRGRVLRGRLPARRLTGHDAARCDVRLGPGAWSAWVRRPGLDRAQQVAGART
jgi:myo-inositol-1-phosphate synthase